MNKPPYGRPTPTPEAVARTRALDAYLLRISRLHPLWWVGLVPISLFVFLTMGFLVEQLNHTFSPKTHPSGVVVQLDSPPKGRGKVITTLSIQGQTVKVLPAVEPNGLKKGSWVTVSCTPQMQCRHLDFESQHGGYMILLAYLLIYFFLVHPVVRVLKKPRL